MDKTNHSHDCHQTPENLRAFQATQQIVVVCENTDILRLKDIGINIFISFNALFRKSGLIF